MVHFHAVPTRRGGSLHDAADPCALTQRVVVVLAPFAGQAGSPAFEDQVRHRPQSSSASRLTAGAWFSFLLEAVAPPASILRHSIRDLGQWCGPFRIRDGYGIGRGPWCF